MNTTTVIGRLVLGACVTLTVPGRLHAQSSSPDLILWNGRIITGDSAWSMAEAVAIRNGRFVAVGRNADIRRLAGAGTRAVDLKRRNVVPGLADGHLHDAGGGPGVDLSGARSLADVLEAIRSAAARATRGDVVFTNSDWHEAQLREQRLPYRADLDRVAPSTPVVIVRGGHELILNSAALRKWNITKGTPVPAGGQISRDAAGELNGELVDRAMALVERPALPPLTTDALKAEFAKLNAAGLTSIRIPGGSVAQYRLVKELRDRGELTIRVNYLFRLTDASSPDRVRAQVASWNAQPGEGDEWLRVGGAKLGVDGGFEGGLMREPYAGEFGRNGTYFGLQTMPEDRFLTALRTLNALGWRVATHAVGDAAIDMVLRGYAAANAERSIVGRRWAVEHAFIARPEQIHEMKQLGLVESAQDHLWLAGPVLVSYWGNDRAALTTPMRSFLDSGLVVASGTDSPVVPYPPLHTFYHFVTRGTISGGVIGAAQAITPREALRAATWGNAFLTEEEDSKGSITVGRLADLVVLSGNPMTTNAAALDRLRVEMTIVGGKVVFDATSRAEGEPSRP